MRHNNMNATTPLRDITNKPHIVKRRRLDGSLKIYSSARKIRKTMDIPYLTEGYKRRFDDKLSKAEDKLGCNTYEELFTRLLDQMIVDKASPEHNPAFQSPVIHENNCNFICSKDKLFELVQICSTQPCVIVNCDPV